nr:hypothetical protein [Spirochaetia bacterium]
MERLLVLVLIFLLFLTAIVVAEETVVDNMISLTTLIGETSLELSWNSYRSMGELSLNGKSILFKPGIPFLLLNYSEKSENFDIKRGVNGDVFFSIEAAAFISSFYTFSPNQRNPLKIKAIIIDPGHG